MTKSECGQAKLINGTSHVIFSLKNLVNAAKSRNLSSNNPSNSTMNGVHSFTSHNEGIKDKNRDSDFCLENETSKFNPDDGSRDLLKGISHSIPNSMLLQAPMQLPGSDQLIDGSRAKSALVFSQMN